MGKKQKKNQLGGHLYLVEETSEGDLVHKVPKEDESREDAEIYLVNKDKDCNCRAADFGADCKHIAMANGSFSGLPVSRRKAERILEEYLDKLRSNWPKAKIVNLVRYRKDTTLVNAAALAWGVLSEHAAEKLTLWTEFGPLLIRVHCFKDFQRYRRALRSVRDKWSGYKPPEIDVGPIGQTYGDEHNEGKKS